MENLCISVHSFTKAWTFIPQVRTLYLLQLQLHKCLRLVSFDFSVYILYAVARNSDPLYSLYTVGSSHLSGAACIPAVSVLSTILVILLVLVLVLTVAVLLLCCKLRTLNTGNVRTCACVLCTMLWHVQYKIIHAPLLILLSYYLLYSSHVFTWDWHSQKGWCD